MFVVIEAYPSAVAELLARLNYVVMEAVEEEVFEAVMRWFLHRPDERNVHIYEVMRFVRFWLVEEHYLYDRVLTSALLRANQQVLALLDEVVHYKLLKDRWIEADLYMEPRYGSDFCRHVWQCLVAHMTELYIAVLLNCQPF